jgi:hypothetical protein
MKLSFERLRQLAEGAMMLIDAPGTSPELRKRAEETLRSLKEDQKKLDPGSGPG